MHYTLGHSVSNENLFSKFNMKSFGHLKVLILFSFDPLFYGETKQ